MDRSSRQMLKFIFRDPVCRDGFCTFPDFYEAYASKTGMDDHSVMACLRYLSECGYIQFGNDQFGDSVGFELNHKAYHRRYFRWVSVRDFMVKSVLVPIIVSVITAIITAYITAVMVSRGVL